MQNLTAGKVRKITLITMLIAVFFLLLGYFVKINLVLFIGWLIFMLALIFYLLFYRCHECGKFLGRDKVKYCPHCGSEVVK